MGRSTPFGKQETKQFLNKRHPGRATILDVGAGKGTYAMLLDSKYIMDAIEIFKPYIEKFKIHRLYRKVMEMDVRDYEFDQKYDIVIMGDVLEHLSFEDARKFINKAKQNCDTIIVQVPYLFRQGPANNNQAETHIQDDLTPELFAERYPEFDVLISGICKSNCHHGIYKWTK